MSIGLHQPFHSIRWATLPWAMAVGFVTWSFTTWEIPARERLVVILQCFCLFVCFSYYYVFCDVFSLYSPCREDRANAAISWMVRALLDFGNISMVSSTFTWKDEKERKKGKRDSVENWCSSSALQCWAEAGFSWLTGKYNSHVFTGKGPLRFSYFKVYFRCLGKWRIFSLHNTHGYFYASTRASKGKT